MVLRDVITVKLVVRVQHLKASILHLYCVLKYKNGNSVTQNRLLFFNIFVYLWACFIFEQVNASMIKTKI